MVASIIDYHARNGLLSQVNWIIIDLAECILSTIALIYDITLLVHLFLDYKLHFSCCEDPQVAILQLYLMEKILIFWKWIFKLHA